ncbi:MAG: DUF6491 family protein [Pseudomonadota bacterium]
MRTTFLPLAIAAVSACATNGAPADARDPGSDPKVGAPQSRVCFNRGINGFAPYGDTGILLREGTNTWYLVTFSDACPNVRFAATIGLGARGTATGCLGRGDRMVVSDGFRPASAGLSTCRVGQLYAYDMFSEPTDRAPTPPEPSDNSTP